MTEAQERIGTLVVRALSAANTWLFRASGGRLGNRFRHGAPVLLLTTVGARSGQRRTTPLVYLADGDDLVVVAAGGGMPHHPAWYHNLLKNPDARVQLADEERPVVARRASGAEKAALWPRLVELQPEYEDHRARSEREIPVMILSPA